MAAVACVLVFLPFAAAQQPCNPVIDGTYCATQMPRTGTSAQQPRISMSPIQDIGSAISLDSSSPATVGGISIRSGGTTCIGLLRRGNCN